MNRTSFFLLVFITFSHLASADIKLPVLVSDGLVLQRDTELKIWGWGEPKEKVTLTFLNKKYTTTTGADGKWSIMIPAQKAGGPHSMQFKGKNEILVSNILFGDVWICSGQSNMVLPMERVKEKYGEDIAKANYPEIRNFFIPTISTVEGPKEDLPPGKWVEANPKDVLTFGSASYFFARDIYEKHKIPIGLINSSVGGTPIEAWISEQGFREFPEITERIKSNQQRVAQTASNPPRPMAAAPNPPAPRVETDKGLAADVKWYEESYKPVNWYPINIPGFWEDQGVKNLNGVVWYRKEIMVPKSMVGKPAMLFMGRIVDADFAYINGKQVGNITYQYPPRRYPIDVNLLREGKNTIVLRVINNSGKGGFVPDKRYVLTTGEEEIDLKGEWHYKVGDVFVPRTFGRGGGRPGGGGGAPPINAQNEPTGLFNPMIAPLIQYPVKGVIWYQGETNAGNPEPYREYMPALIRDWREQWGQKEMPFIFVQLANFMDIDYSPTESSWAETREAQAQGLKEPNTAMAVAIDLGEWNDIHPLNKGDVGRRLALGARHLAYGEKDLVYSGPQFASQEIKGNKIEISFNHIGSGLVSIDGEPLSRFEVAGMDNHFVWANAEIQGNKVVVWSEEVDKPISVRYAWADNPMGANLYNKEGLPTAPFQTKKRVELDKSADWMGKECAVVLTYDDALNVHLDNVMPLLDSLNLKGTFYLSGFFPGFKSRINDWRNAARTGHEMANHTLFHPCDGQLPGRDWVSPQNDLTTYTLARMEDEARMTNVLLQTLDGKTKRTFAFTCGDMKIGDEEIMKNLKADFVGARAVRSQMHKMNQIDVYNFDSYGINGETGEELIELVKQARASNTLLVFLFHGVGGEHSLNVDLPSHRALLHYLKENEDSVWTTTMLEAAEHVIIQQGK